MGATGVEFPGEICYCGTWGFWEKQSGYYLVPDTGYWVHDFCHHPSKANGIRNCCRCKRNFVPAIFDPLKLSVCPSCRNELAEAAMLNRYHDEPRIRSADDSVKISNSEVSSFLKCERRHFYQYRLRLASRGMSRSLGIGIVFHEAAAALYNSVMINPNRKEGYAEGFAAGNQRIQELLLDDISNIEIYSRVAELFERYAPWAEKNDNFKVLDVERAYYMPIPDGGPKDVYPMRIDLLVQYTSGKYEGQIALWDHKTTYDFWSEDALYLNAQIPKYMGVLQFNGVAVRRAVINQIRTRKNKGPMGDDELFKRSPMHIERGEIRSLLREQFIASERIQKLNALTEQEHSDSILRAMDRFTCENCPMLKLCKVELSGQDSTAMKSEEYIVIDTDRYGDE